MQYALTMEQLAALKAYAAENGHAWKSALRVDWMTGKNMTPELQQIRNHFGPIWLQRFRLKIAK
jgi:hypothetical protein